MKALSKGVHTIEEDHSAAMGLLERGGSALVGPIAFAAGWQYPVPSPEQLDC